VSVVCNVDAPYSGGYLYLYLLVLVVDGP